MSGTKGPEMGTELVSQLDLRIHGYRACKSTWNDHLELSRAAWLDQLELVWSSWRGAEGPSMGTELVNSLEAEQSQIAWLSILGILVTILAYLH